MERHDVGEEVLETRDIRIAGMTCDGCVRRVEKALRRVSGVTELRVDRKTAIATVTFDTMRTDVQSLYDALIQSGYRPTTAVSR
jgi:copper chaperone CopZ